ncbi:unnamed protein product [Phytophthora fragariaefolia]|uniref:Kinesin-like protein n=1 Tax=Phytophthora fragariaefolia TaxID=1490495 RepID=A0A9W7CU20_9STRA|nr:unnamed protein product [Phytophthora fragariaefolia]
MNTYSSRSHAICTLTMEQHDVSAPEGGTETRLSKFHLVDLAGSERVRRTNAEGARFKEGVNINRGLLALGNVINALCDRSRTSSVVAHVPYRDSKLTRLLQDSLGGNSKTLMIACISPADANYEETSNTLRYASRARSIENQAVVNKERSTENEVAFLKRQLEIVQLQLLQQTHSVIDGSAQVDRHNISALDENEKLLSNINSLIMENQRLKRELLLANNAKEKWKGVADELTNKNKDVNRLDQLKTPSSVKMRILGTFQRDASKQELGNSSSSVSRLEQLRRFQSQKTMSKGSPTVKRKADDTISTNKRSRMLMSPSSNIQSIGKKNLFNGSPVLPSPGQKRELAESGVPAMETITTLLQQVMDSQDAILSAKEAVRTNLADRKALALKISRLEKSPPSGNDESIDGLRDNLRRITANIRLLQHKLTSIERTSSLPSGLFPTRVDACHELIRRIIYMLKDSREESMTHANSQKEIQALENKLKESTIELEALQRQLTKKKAVKKRKARESYETMETLFSSSDEEDDNSDADSDYVDDEDRRKTRTKRNKNSGTPATKASASKNADVMDEIDELLETSAATCCFCHNKCATKACACKSQNRDCGDECSCEPSKCRNKRGTASVPCPKIPATQVNNVADSSTPKSAGATSEVATVVYTPTPVSAREASVPRP